jgi:hypothetical protein
MNLTVGVKNPGWHGAAIAAGANEVGAVTGNRGLGGRAANQFGTVTEGTAFRRSRRAQG